MEGTLLSLGSINADFQMRIDCAPGSHEMLQARDFRRLPGGKAGNTAYLGVLFGLRSRLLGRVGDDELAAQALEPLQRAGVDISCVSRTKECMTAVSIILVPPNGKKHIVLASNANECWDESAVTSLVESIASGSRPACLAVDCEVPAWVVRRAVDCAWDNNIPVVLDPSFPERFEHDLLGKLWAITPNVSEAEALLGKRIDSLEKAAEGVRQLYDKGVYVACIKLADGGCVLMADGQITHVQPGESPVVDTTGAGDAFTGMLAIALLEGRGPVEAAAWAVAAANVAVAAYGSQDAYAGRDQVQTMAEQLLRSARRLDG